MARGVPRGGMNFTITAKDVDRVLGACRAFADVADKSQFLSDMISYGADEANKAFYEKVVQFHTSSGGQTSLRHMFDWGRNEGDINVNKPLWRYSITGSGKTKQLRFDFVPSTTKVPKKTTKGTGIDQQYLRNQRRYTFYNKAVVMETGVTLTIKPKEAKALMIPFRGAAPAGARPNDLKRGFTMRPEVTVTPGRKFKGNFTSFWFQFFTGDGQRVFESSITKEIRRIFEEQFLAANSGGNIFDLKDLSSRVTAYQTKAEKRLIDEAHRRAEQSKSSPSVAMTRGTRR